MEGIIFGTPEEQLNTVNEAVYAVLKGGQSYQIGTRKLTRADLSELLWTCRGGSRRGLRTRETVRCLRTR